MTGEHTPGPWRTGQEHDGTVNVWVIAGERQLVADVTRAADARSFRWCTGPSNEDESLANARLIAAAPDLLNAIRDFRGIVTTLLSQADRPRGPHPDDIEEANRMMLKAGRLLAKATGEMSS